MPRARLGWLIVISVLTAGLAACGDNSEMVCEPMAGDECCPAGGNQLIDPDCSAACGNGAVESGESCDRSIPAGTPGACPEEAGDCDDGLACTEDALAGTACDKACTHTEITAAGTADGCCPAGATDASDPDCSPSCGDGIVSGGETCDSAIPNGEGSCPTTCGDGDSCTDDRMLSAGTCNAQCANQPVTLVQDGDGCCAAGANANVDDDCAYVCGNGVVEAGESCDTEIAPGVLGACPGADDCDDGDPCTADTLEGAGCAARCQHGPITSPLDGDGCCPASGDANNDLDCPAVCGNGVYEPGVESCDIAIATGGGACPGSSLACSDGNACTADAIEGVGCQAGCGHGAVTTCVSGDGCCVAGCTSVQDTDCSATCGNGVVDAGETCDTAIPSGPGQCPTIASCDDGIACTAEAVQSSGTCNAQCVNNPITSCTDGDGCCPGGCNANNDNTCAPVCGNGVVETGELCDPALPGSCPTTCNDGNSCTSDVLVGGGTCAAHCESSPVVPCCGNGVVESGETCDRALPPGSPGGCPTPALCDDGCAATDDALMGSAITCTAECSNPQQMCDLPGAGQFAACGRVYELDDMQPVTAATHDVTRMEIRVYDPIEYLQNPSTAVPVGYAAIDGCGYWEAQDVPTTFSGFIAPAVEDCSAGGAAAIGCTVSAADAYVATGAAARALDGEIEWGWVVYATTQAVNSALTTQAQANGYTGTSLAQTGVFAPIFIDYSRPAVLPYGGTPAEDVSVLLEGVPVPDLPNRDWYFEDPSRLLRTDVAPASVDVTGANGTGVFAPAPALGNYSGSGGLPSTCSWRETLATSLSTVYFVMEFWPSCCAVDADCATSARGPVCQEEICHPACSVDADCPAAMRCIQHMGGPGACRVSAGYIP